MKVYALRFNIYLVIFAALLLGGGCKTGGSADKHDQQLSGLRIHIEANADTIGMSQTISLLRADPVTITVEKDPILTETDVVLAQVLDTPAGFAVELKFSDSATLILEQYSASNPGKHFVILGQWGDKDQKPRGLAAPLITHRIADGVLAFTPDMSRDEAYRFVLGLNNVSKQIAKGPVK